MALALDDPLSQDVYPLPDVALPVLALTSAHLSGARAREFKQHCDDCQASHCGGTAHAFVDLKRVPDVERQWRVVQHHL